MRKLFLLGEQVSKGISVSGYRVYLCVKDVGVNLLSTLPEGVMVQELCVDVLVRKEGARVCVFFPLIFSLKAITARVFVCAAS